MKYIELFEFFDYTDKDGHENENNIQKILTDKAVNIIAISSADHEKNPHTLSPNIIITNNHKLTKKRYLYQANFTDTNVSTNYQISFGFYDNDGRGFDVYKDHSLRVDIENVTKMVRVLEDASSYVDFEITHDMEMELYKFFQSDKNRQKFKL